MSMNNPRIKEMTASPAYRLISKMQAGKENAIIICNSDSTGITGDYDGAVYYNKWLYKLAVYLGNKYPAYTVQYYDVVPAFYNIPVTLNVGNQKANSAIVASGGSGYAVGDNIYLQGGITLSVTTVSSGAVTGFSITATGSLPATSIPSNPSLSTGTSGSGTGASFNVTYGQGVTLYFYNAAFAGTQATYLMGMRFQAVFNPRPDADLIIFNHGHNTDGNASPNTQQGMNMAAIYSITQYHPSAGVLVVSQNPIRDDDSGTNRSAGSRQTATAGGFGLLDVNELFLRFGKPNSWYRIVPATGKFDTIHPGAVGDQNIYELALPLFSWPVLPIAKQQGLDYSKNILTNADFQAWTNLSAAPDGWTASNLTMSKNNTAGQFEKGAYSLQLVNSSTSEGLLTQALSAGMVRLLAGRTITIAARMYIPASNTLSTAARISIAEVDNTTTYGIPTGGRDGFIWKAVVVAVPPSATSITMKISTGIAGSAAGFAFYLDRVTLCLGNIPKDFTD